MTDSILLSWVYFNIFSVIFLCPLGISYPTDLSLNIQHKYYSIPCVYFQYFLHKQYKLLDSYTLRHHLSHSRIGQWRGNILSLTPSLPCRTKHIPRLPSTLSSSRGRCNFPHRPAAVSPSPQHTTYQKSAAGT